MGLRCLWRVWAICIADVHQLQLSLASCFCFAGGLMKHLHLGAGDSVTIQLRLDKALQIEHVAPEWVRGPCSAASAKVKVEVSPTESAGAQSQHSR